MGPEFNGFAPRCTSTRPSLVYWSFGRTRRGTQHNEFPEDFLN